MASNSLTLLDKTQLWENCQASSHFGCITVDNELIQADDAVLVDVHAGEHLLHVVGFHLGMDLGPDQVVYGVCDLGDMIYLNI